MDRNRTLAAVGIPDLALLDPLFTSTALLYFDELGIPDISEPMQDQDLDSLAEMLRRPPFITPPDLEGDIQRYRRLRDCIHGLQSLEAHGLISRLEPETGFLGSHRSAVLNLTNHVINQPGLLEDIESTSAQDVWVSRGSGIQVSSPDKERNASSRTIMYCWEVVRRIVHCEVNGCSLVTNSQSHYSALHRIQAALSFSRVAVTPPLTLELIRLALPRVVARSIDDILAIRTDLKDFLEPFRIEIARAAATANPDNPNAGHVEEARRAFDREIRPKLAELRSFLESPGRRFLNHLVPDTKDMLVAGVSLVCMIKSGLPITVSAASPPVAAAISALVKTLTEQRRTKKTNPLTFAILAEDRISAEANSHK